MHHISGDHWITSCSIGREVVVYDSRYNGDDFHPSLTHQLALIYRASITIEEDGENVDPHLVIHTPPVQQQKGDSDCGVHAIKFALGDTIKDIEFDQP